MLRRLGLLVVACAFIPSLASALTLSALPDGMCALDEKIPEQAVVAQYLRGANTSGNTLAASFASCDELKALADKKATSINHYGSVLQQAVASDVIMLDRPAYLAGIAAAYEKNSALTQALSEVAAATAQGSAASGASAPSTIGATSKGVLYKDPRMVIIGLEQTNNFGTQATQVASTAGVTMLRDGSPLSVNIYAPATDKDSFAKSTDLIKPFINRMVRENQ